MVDLQAVYEVKAVTLLNRDKAPERLGNFTIIVSRDSVTSNLEHVDPSSVCAFQSEPIKASEMKQFDCTMTGRYVTVTKPEGSELTLCEVYVWASDEPLSLYSTEALRNVALNKPANQSTTRTHDSFGSAGNAIDGNTDTRYHSGGCSHTAASVPGAPWWMVDLQAVYEVKAVTLLNRDKAPERLGNFTIIVSRDSVTSNLEHVDQSSVCAFQSEPIKASEMKQFDCTMTGRYVTVTKPEGSELTLCEVYVWASDEPLSLYSTEALRNVALNRPAYQSTTYADAGRAVDGNNNTRFGDGSCSCTKPSRKFIWWMVDLQAVYEVKAVTLLNRGDCCAQRLENFKIIVSRENVTSNLEHVDPSSVCAFQSESMKASEKKQFDCTITGRYVTVTKPEGSALTLCEVYVWANDGPLSMYSTEALRNVALNRPAYQSTTFADAGGAVDGNTNTRFGAGSCSSTEGSPRFIWWMVDLQAVYEVKAVTLLNRGDCCAERLGNFKIIVSRENVTSNLEHVDPSSVCAFQSESMKASEMEEFDCTITGRYVTVTKPEGSAVALCEVYVWASDEPSSLYSAEDTYEIYTHVDVIEPEPYSVMANPRDDCVFKCNVDKRCESALVKDKWCRLYSSSVKIKNIALSNGILYTTLTPTIL
ncbi:uncharacterized protein LOC141904481 [Tubulanus polymorphus]|uniref:uncharacterized protein LOC141904481 n=1 Tax=Tubulanus polymorphus TaxID=672921 RepID=UPI003DA3BA2F